MEKKKGTGERGERETKNRIIWTWDTRKFSTPRVRRQDPLPAPDAWGRQLSLIFRAVPLLKRPFLGYGAAFSELNGDLKGDETAKVGNPDAVTFSDIHHFFVIPSFTFLFCCFSSNFLNNSQAT